MNTIRFKTKTSIAEYLEGENSSSERHEFIDGEVYAMAGASERHHRICANLFIKIDAHLDNSKCNAFITNMKLQADEKTFYYPDVFVACDENPESEYYRQNPVLIIEIVSPSTRQIDCREKLRAYQQMSDVREYVIIEQDNIYLELHRRQSDGNWITYFYSDVDEEITLESIDLTLKIADIYRRVNF